MKALFFNMLGASFYGSVVILAVLLLRLVLKKAPKSMVCLLWLLAAARLVMPFTIESRLSLQPPAENIAQIRQEMVSGSQTGDDVQTQTGQIPAIPQDSDGQAALPGDVQIFISDDAVTQDAVTNHTQRVTDYGAIAAWIWMSGIAGLLGYSAWSYWRLRSRVREAVRMEDGSWECPGLDTAFVLGLFRPRIYLPGGLSDRDRELILAHERCHIARKDHWIKPLGYLVLMLHWFNPLVWLAYVCLCRDIEMACDERVVKKMDVADRKDYSLALLNCSTRGLGIAACPVAFGEVGVKQRILGVLHYRKPGFWIVVAAVAAVVFVVACLMTGPETKSDSPLDPENAASMLENRSTVITVEYRQNINGSISVCKADGARAAEILADADFRSWLVSESHGDFTAYVDLEILEGLSLRIFDNGHADVIRGEEIRHYGAPKGLYQRLHELMEPAVSQDVITAALEMGSSVWNLNMTVDNISPTGLRLCFTQSGWFPGSATGSLRYGAAFGLERFDGESWVPVEKVTGDEVTAWATVAYLIQLDDTVSHTGDWSWLYGELPPGRYRIVKDVSLDIPNQESLDADFYAEFYLVDDHMDTYIDIEPLDSWGLTPEVRDVTPTGMTLVCTHWGNTPGEIIAGEEFEIFAKKGQGWVQLPAVTHEVIWKDIAWVVNKNGQTQWTLDWEWLYGALPQGEYVLHKKFSGDFPLEMYVPFTVGEATVSHWRDLPALEVCRRALEEFKSRESGYVTWENTFGSNGVIRSRVTGEYWFAGENWLRKIDPNHSLSVWRPSYLGMGNMVYRSSGDEVEEWIAVGDEGAAGLQPWIFGLEWDEEKISLLYDECVGEEWQITVEVRGTPPAVVDGSVTQYQVTFRFDGDGRLLGTDYAYLEPSGDEVETMVVSTMNIPQTTNQNPEQVLAEAMEPLLREENRYLELCREALAAFQADETWYISVQTVSAYDGPRMEYQSEMWGDGEDRLCKLSSQQINDGSSHCWLVKDGRCYTRDLGNRGDMDLSYDTGWYQVDAFSEQETEVWQRELDWNSANITWRSTQETEGGVTVICGTDLCMDFLEGQGEVADSRLEFRLDADGNLVSIGWTLEYTDGGIFSQTSTISWDSDAAIRAAIEAEAAETLRPEYTYYLEQCRVVLEGFQKLDSYHVVQQDFYGGSILNSSTVTNYWRSGDDWCHIAQNRDVDNGHIVHRLKKDGVEYLQELYNTLTEDPQGRPWSVMAVPSDCMNGNWLEVFSWEDSMVEHVITDAAGDGGTVVTMAVKEDPSAFGKYCPYEAHLHFEPDGRLKSVELILQENQGEQNWYMINAIYNVDYLENPDAQIDAVYEEVYAAMNCTDPNCTDVTHYHYGIACTVEGCENPAHGHGGHDHH